MGRVIHFEIHADDPQRAAAFYRAIFGWEVQRWAGPVEYWLVTTGPADEPGINGAILPRNTPLEGGGIRAFVCTIDVDNLDESLAKALAEGASLALPKHAVPGIGWNAYVTDTEGNLIGLMQPDPAAK